jgi:hypothetical protein
MKYYLTIFLSLIFLNGCAGSGEYNTPLQTNSSLNASLKGTVNRQSLLHYDFFSIDAVDDKAVSHLIEGAEKQVQIAPGKHTIVTHAVFNRTFGGSCPCEAHLALQAEFEPQKEYKLNGKVEGITISAWIEEKGTSKRVSDIASQPYRAARRDTYVYVPVN